MPDDEPKWRRRKEARPGEIVEAALEVFAEKGFAAAKLDEIARRAGVSKGSLYLYFETKEDIFRAFAQAAVASLLEAIESPAEVSDAPFADVAPKLLSRAAGMMSGGQVPALARMAIGESRNFPDLARIWHDDVVANVIGTVTGIIARAQARGEVAPGDPRFHAFSLMGPMVMAMLFREVFGGERRTELLRFTDEGDRVVCAAGYIAGCDGARSIVRETIGTGFPGGTYRQLFYVADVESRRTPARRRTPRGP